MYPLLTGHPMLIAAPRKLQGYPRAVYLRAQFSETISELQNGGMVFPKVIPSIIHSRWSSRMSHPGCKFEYILIRGYLRAMHLRVQFSETISELQKYFKGFSKSGSEYISKWLNTSRRNDFQIYIRV